MERLTPTQRFERPNRRPGRTRFAAWMFAVALSIFAAVPLVSPFLQTSTAALGRSVGGDGNLLLSASETMPFIRYSPKGWILADAPPGEALTVCEVLERRYRCPVRDQEEHGRAITKLEEELRIRPR